MEIMYPEPWLTRLIERALTIRGRLDTVEQILAVIGDDGNVDPDESGEIANLLFEIGDLSKEAWQIAARLSASGYLKVLRPLEVSR
jgi:hypothetical protein